MKRILALLLILSMLPLPTVLAAQPQALSQSAYDAVTDDIWRTIEQLETQSSAKRSLVQRNGELLAQIISAVEASDTYVENSLVRNGDFFTWETTEGVVCGYSPRLRAKIRASAVQDADPEDYAAVERVSYALRGGSASAKDVAVFQPYYGLDRSFTKQYVNEGTAIAKATGGTSTSYITSEATINAVADALETSAVVIFDSHGDTDYENPYNADDFTSRANTSYLCLQSGVGLTTEDQQKAIGTYGTYYHAYYAGSYDKMQYYCVDGTAIANHMEKSAPNSLLWMPICLGMATDGIQAPLRAKGVEVVYGYSQSVSFDGDYQYEKLFWQKMRAGATVAEAITEMKAKYGDWDPAYRYSSAEKAAKNYAAFPIIVSGEDPYPGKGKVDAVQTVYSQWTLLPAQSYTVSFHVPEGVQTPEPLQGASVLLPAVGVLEDYHFVGWVSTPLTEATQTVPDFFAAGSVYKPMENITLYALYSIVEAEKTTYTTEPRSCRHQWNVTQTVQATCETDGYTVKTCMLCNKTETVDIVAALGHTMQQSEVVAPTCTAGGYTLFVCSRCEYTEHRDEMKATGHSYEQTLTPPTALEQGYTTHTCVHCGDTYRDSYTEALGVEYHINFCVPDGVTPIASLSCNSKNSLLLPDKLNGTPKQSRYAYRFIGWVMQPLAASTKLSSIALPGSTVYLTGDTTFYAAYSYMDGDVLYYTTELQDILKLNAASSDEQMGSVVLEGMTVTALASDGYCVAGFTLTPADAAKVTQKGNVFTVSGQKSDCTLTVRFAKSAPKVCPSKAYNDIDVKLWYHEALDFLLSNGYMNGVAAHRFDPEGRLTRAMMVTILYRLDGKKQGGTHSFVDVPKESWYDDAVAWGCNAGVIKGTDATHFSPEEYLTREQAAAMLYRYANYCGQTTEVSGGLDGFSDATQVSAYALDAMRWAVGAGIINGKSAVQLDPLGITTRAEIAKLLYGWLK